MRGICIDPGPTLTLLKDKKYFLFEHGPNNFYVSKFDNVGAHCGSYEKRFFKLVDEQLIVPIKPQRYIAVISKYRNGYNMGDNFIISDPGPNGYYHVYLMDRPNGSPIGSYITNFFEIIGPYKEDKMEVAIKPPERTKLKALISPVINPLLDEEKPEKQATVKPKKVKQAIPVGQMDIFDFLEG